MIYYIKWCKEFSYRHDDKHCNYVKIYAMDKFEAVATFLYEFPLADYYEIIRIEKARTIIEYLKVMFNKVERLTYVD